MKLLLSSLLHRHFQPILMAVQVMVDVVVVLFSCFLAYSFGLGVGSIRGSGNGFAQLADFGGTYATLAGLTALVSIATFRFCGLYSSTKSLLNVEEYKNIAKSVMVSFLVFFTLLVFLRTSSQSLDVPFFGLVAWIHNQIDLDIRMESISRLTILLSFVAILVFMTIV